MKQAEDDFMSEMRDRFDASCDDDKSQRDCSLSDIKFAFVPGNQWEEGQKKKRKNRPCYEFNKIRQSIRQITGDQRQNRPSVKVRAVEEGDKDTAETLQGLIRNIEAMSSADRAYDTAFELAVTGGIGFWRIATDYSDDSAFDQDILIEEIRNPFTVHLDPHASDYNRRDGMYAFVTEKISREAFEARYPEAEAVSFEDSETSDDWWSEDEIRIAEYWVKEPVTRTICLMSDGKTVDKDEISAIVDELASAGVTVVKEREIKTHKVVQYIVSGAEVLEGPNEWAGKYIPIVPVWGDLINVEGQELFSGVVRHSKDSQRMYNFNRTTAIEHVAKSPKAPYLVTPTQVDGFQKYWDASNSEDFPYLPYNPDSKAPGVKPFREPGPEVPQSMIALLSLDSDDLKATTGIYDASLGNRSNETSGRAILARQKEGDTATFSYIDNLGRAIQYTGEILIDLIPKIYDTPRVVRILGEDGGEKWAQVNQTVIDQQTGQPVVINDLSRGRFDVTVTVGPSYATQRMEMAESLMQLAGQNPQMGALVTDLVVKNLDMPGSQEVEKRMRRMLLQQGAIEPNEEERQSMPQGPTPEQQMAMQAAQIEMQTKQLELMKLQKELQSPDSESTKLQIAQLRAEVDMAREQMKARTADEDRFANVLIKVEELTQRLDERLARAAGLPA